MSAYAVECRTSRNRTLQTRPSIENRVGLLLFDVVLLAAGNEALALHRHFVWLFLAHRATQKIRFPEAVAGDLIGNLQNLVLVHDHAERVCRELFENRQRVLDLRETVFSETYSSTIPEPSGPGR